MFLHCQGRTLAVGNKEYKQKAQHGKKEIQREGQEKNRAKNKKVLTTKKGEAITRRVLRGLVAKN